MCMCMCMYLESLRLGGVELRAKLSHILGDLYRRR
jgi:hypothetical protein